MIDRSIFALFNLINQEEVLDLKFVYKQVWVLEKEGKYYLFIKYFPKKKKNMKIEMMKNDAVYEKLWGPLDYKEVLDFSLMDYAALN